jgi:2-polyprenyl-3-methyl-5-hydroxy-6-metoxy-1,4-benzoquinol methylase
VRHTASLFKAKRTGSIHRDLALRRQGWLRGQIPDNPADPWDMNEISSNPEKRKFRLLVAIASFGEKNLKFLKRIIETYRNMSMDVDVVVYSDAPRDLGEGVKVVVVVETLWPFFRRWPQKARTEVKVVVGWPTTRLWSLPFAHKDLFAHNLDKYDLFAYSEDDVLVTETNVQAFLRATPQLGADEIAGFLRYEVDGTGKWSMPEMHGPFHWRSNSVSRRGEYTVAEFSNEHAAFYLLTQNQLRRAIASGGYLSGPYEGRHDPLCTAATDPYLCCGFRKVICISALDDFLIHHLPNRYADQFGLSLQEARDQVQTLNSIQRKLHPSSTLSEAESKMPLRKWSKDYHEAANEDFLEMIPEEAKTVLSVGCGCGDTETRLKLRGCEVTALPLDSVVGAAVSQRNIEVVYGAWDECLQTLGSRRYDCVFVRDLIHLRARPGQFVEQCARLVKEGGALVLAGPNFNRVPWFLKRMLGVAEFRMLRNFNLSGVSVCGPESLAGHLKEAGLRVSTVHWLNHTIGRGRRRHIGIRFGRFTAREWVLQARRVC